MIASPAPPAGQLAARSPCNTEALHGDRADLLRRVHQALQVAGHAMGAAAVQCAPAPRAPEAEASGVRPLVLEKVMAEAAMLMRCAAFLRDESDDLATAMDTLAHQVAPHARSEAVLARLCQEPQRAIEHSAAHVYLSDIGHRDEGFDRFLQEVLDGEPVGGAERLPNHTLECHWLGQMRSRAVHTAPIDSALLARTCVALPLDLLGCSTLDLYAFTHVVLYASDMGQHDAAWPRPLDEIAAEAEAALAVALDADNFDLAAELLWTWPMLGLAWSDAARFGFEMLASVQDDCGFLPGPQYALKPGADHPRPDDEAVLRSSYHATLVMGMLCAAALRAGRAPEPGVAGTPADSKAVDMLLRHLPALPRSPRWRDALARLSPARRSGLAPFVLTLVFRRAAAAHDLPRLRAGLEAALEGDLAQGPSVRQALALLRRATSLARLKAGGPAGINASARPSAGGTPAPARDTAR